MVYTNDRLPARGDDRRRPTDGVVCRAVYVMLVAMMLVALPAGTRCEDVDSLCIHFTSSRENVHLQLTRDYGLGGNLPFTACDLISGAKYRMKVSGDGLESRLATFVINRSGRASVNGIRSGAMIRNAVFPGWGSVFAERTSVGWTDGFSICVAGYLLFVEDREFRDLRDDFYYWNEKFDNADLLEDKEKFKEAAIVARLKANVQNTHRKRLAVLTAALYGHQLIDPLLSNRPPRMKREAGGNVLVMNTGTTNRGKAAFYSLLRPGRGQFYQGKTMRGLLFSTLTLAAGFLALDYHNECDKAESDYTYIIDRFDRTANLETKKLLRREADRSWELVEDARLERNIAYAVCGALWGWSILDALLLPGERPLGTRYSFELDGSGAALVLRF
ncbi:MAG: hypothetical protein JSV33_15610 [bacterium]|nr:MAG: hypothetical protein JSV33_15610 [bacterium]